MSYYPVFLQLEDRPALVVGGGAVASRKVETLLAYGASVYVVSKAFTPALQGLIHEGRVTSLGERFEEKHLDGMFLVIAATDDETLNHEVSEQARSRRLLVNAVDQPADCTFIVPSIVRRGDLLIAISTSGKSPAFAKRLRKALEVQYGDAYGTFLELMGRIREKVLALGLSQAENSRIFQEIVDAGLPEIISTQQWDKVVSMLETILPDRIRVTELIKP